MRKILIGTISLVLAGTMSVQAITLNKTVPEGMSSLSSQESTSYWLINNTTDRKLSVQKSLYQMNDEHARVPAEILSKSIACDFTDMATRHGSSTDGWSMAITDTKDNHNYDNGGLITYTLDDGTSFDLHFRNENERIEVGIIEDLGIALTALTVVASVGSAVRYSAAMIEFSTILQSAGVTCGNTGRLSEEAIATVNSLCAKLPGLQSSFYFFLGASTVLVIADLAWYFAYNSISLPFKGMLTIGKGVNVHPWVADAAGAYHNLSPDDWSGRWTYANLCPRAGTSLKVLNDTVTANTVMLNDKYIVSINTARLPFAGNKYRNMDICDKKGYSKYDAAAVMTIADVSAARDSLNFSLNALKSNVQETTALTRTSRKSILDQATNLTNSGTLRSLINGLPKGRSADHLSLSAGDIGLVSDNGRYRLIYQGDGNLIVFEGDRAVWSSGTQLPSGASQSSFSYTAGSMEITYLDASLAPKKLWAASDFIKSLFNRLMLLDDGRLVVQDSDNKIVWNSEKDGGCPVYTWSGTCVKGGDLNLANGQMITSPNGRYELIMEGNPDGTGSASFGNPVVYDKNTFSVIWKPSCINGLGKFLKFQNDGNLVVYDKNGMATWNSNTWTSGTHDCKIGLGDDGGLRIYRDSVPVWSSK